MRNRFLVIIPRFSKVLRSNSVGLGLAGLLAGDGGMAGDGEEEKFGVLAKLAPMGFKL